MNLELTFKRRFIYISSNLTHSQNSVAANEEPSIKISSHGTSLK